MDILIGTIVVVAIIAGALGLGYLCARSPGFSALAILLSLLSGE